MLAYIRYRRTIQPHGQEWKTIFGDLLAKYMGKGIFPDNVEEALIRYQGKITASTCSDPDLYRH
jgi:SprT protein